jgi:hypothetical protein
MKHKQNRLRLGKAWRYFPSLSVSAERFTIKMIQPCFVKPLPLEFTMSSPTRRT